MDAPDCLEGGAKVSYLVKANHRLPATMDIMCNVHVACWLLMGAIASIMQHEHEHLSYADVRLGPACRQMAHVDKWLKQAAAVQQSNARAATIFQKITCVLVSVVPRALLRLALGHVAHLVFDPVQRAVPGSSRPDCLLDACNQVLHLHAANKYASQPYSFLLECAHGSDRHVRGTQCQHQRPHFALQQQLVCGPTLSANALRLVSAYMVACTAASSR